MSKQPMGKTLLRNVIRHTDAHNKTSATPSTTLIQEEMEMWKMRDWEINTSQHKPFPDTDSMRGSMHCDRVPDLSRNRSGCKERVSEHDNRDAQNWTRKLYEFEAKDPDRWGHSGFKELYPEEFESDNEKRGAIRKTGRHKMKKSKSDTEAYLSKRSKKSSRKKKKKKKKKSGDGKRRKDEPSNSDCSSDDRSDMRSKQKKKRSAKGRHKNKKVVKTRGGDEDSSSSGDSGDEKNSDRRTNSRKKRKHDSVKDWDSELDSKKKKRKNWKAAGEESSDDSSTD